ncbi:MAG: primosomal protein N' [Alphaproteobacteria bacterium]|nr:primosomal protein N' [Alphaproteobacteria bacterium]MCL2889747.1 primosomal protein N' [Alphaproteobacteria bacterium]
MFQPGDTVCVLIPNAGGGNGYDYRLTTAAECGQFVRVTVMNRPYVGVIIGPGTSNLAPEKIKPVLEILDYKLSSSDLIWIKKMSEWTMMPMGAVLKLIINIPDAFNPPKTEPLYIYTPDPKSRMTAGRQSVADAFAENPGEALSANDISQIARVSDTIVRTMIKNGILKLHDKKIINHKSEIINYFDTGNIKLNTEQQSAADQISALSSQFSVHLLDGITGSGKTQVYFDAAMRVYESGKSVLLMMPEIALTAQFRGRFTDRFGAPPIVWHSNLTAARRRKIWRGVASGDIRIIVGTRSALFLPWRDLGLIVVDEEHDTSYKQEDMGNYHARDMAILRAHVQDFPVILASATPSAETVKKVADGAYRASRLTSRFGGATLPRIETIDMRVRENRCDDSLSVPTANAITETLTMGQQAMLFINRRGFAPITQCKSCGWVAECPDCSTGMTHHKKIGKLLCHICGRTAPATHDCPECNSGELSSSGAGVEKIESEVRARWPNARTAIVSSDTMQSRQSLERLVAQMESGEIDIIIGTQILAKGHHFPNLTLVGVIDADMGLFGTDFRAAEKTFQQLFQVAGRAGRGQHPGRVLLQTYQSEHPVFRAIVAGDRDAAMNMDLSAREKAMMPPYGQLIAIIVEGKKESELQKFCTDLAASAPKIMGGGGKIMGPIPAQIYQIRNWYRMRFLVAGPARARLQPVVESWVSKIKIPANIKIKIDVNPQNFI